MGIKPAARAKPGEGILHPVIRRSHADWLTHDFNQLAVEFAQPVERKRPGFGNFVVQATGLDRAYRLLAAQQQGIRVQQVHVPCGELRIKAAAGKAHQRG